MEDQLGIGVRDGRCISIDDVPSGLACNCVCAKCGKALVAKKGLVRAHHFAHNVDAGCKGAGESALHLAAKQILEEGRLWLPSQQLVVADSVDVEVARGKVRPDVVIVVGGRELLVEIKVTHAVSDEKRDRIRAMGLACVEIDLSSVRRDVTLRDLAPMVVGDGEDAAPRHWISWSKEFTAVKKRALRLRRTRRRDVFGQGDSAWVCGCPKISLSDTPKPRVAYCIKCPHHVASFANPDRDRAVQAEITGSSSYFRGIYCDHPSPASSTPKPGKS